MVIAHPVIPFVTQEIWSTIPSLDVESLAQRPYPKLRPECENEEAVRDMELVQGAIVAVRNIRAELGVAPGVHLHVLVRAGGEEQRVLVAHETEIAALARVKALTVAPDVEPPRGCASAVVRGCELFVPLAGVVDFEAELARLDKELGKLSKELEFVTKKLGNESFVSKAPEDVVAKEKAKAAEFAEKKAALEQLRDKVLDFIGE
jgi:valyl-tRNA synthetase